MKKTIYIICSALVFFSCQKDKKEKFSDCFQEESIEFAPYEASYTKAMMDDAALKTIGNKLHVYDVLDGFSGTVKWMDENNPFYINDEVRYNGNPVWEYVSGRTYPWTIDGSHLFFGWLSYDKTLDKTDAGFFGNSYGFDSSAHTLVIPTLEMNTSTTQFDFMYSKVSLVDAADHIAGQPVNLELQHLFSALNLTLKNTSGNTIYLKSVVLKDMKNVRSANIAFTQNIPTVTTGDLASTDVTLYESSENDGHGTEFVFEDAELDLTNFLLMWPQTNSELLGAKLEVKYYIYVNSTYSNELTANIILSNQNIFKTNHTGMNAGTKYTFQLQFKKSSIDVYIYALPWDYEEYDWDYSDHSISARSGMFRDGVLAFYRGEGENAAEPTAEEWSAKAMRFQTRNEVMTGRFYIESPREGRWQIQASPISAAQYFVISPASGDIDVYNNNGKCEFTVRVNPEVSPTSTQNLYFSVQLFFNGEWHDANSEFNRKNIRLVLDAN